jgi:hypothetical protein
VTDTRMVSAADWRSSRGRRRPPPPVEGPGYPGACVAAAVVTVFAAMVAGWWTIGDLTDHGLARRDLDYEFRAPDVPGWLVAALGAVAIVTIVGIVLALIVATTRRVVDRRWLGIIVMCAVAGWLSAGIARVCTAGSIGANIGAGLAMMFGGPIVAGLLVWASLTAAAIVRKKPA